MESEEFYFKKKAEEALEAYHRINDSLYSRLKNEALKKFLRNNLSPIKDKTVLELGAGGGIWTKFWLDEGARVTSIDVNPLILLGNKMVNPETDFIIADATHVKLETKFDIIFAKDIIEHIGNDERLLENILEHMKDEGYLFINTQNLLSLNYLIEGGYKIIIMGKKNWCGWDPAHLRFYNFRRLSAKLKALGLIPVKWWGTYYFPYRFLSRLIFKKIKEWRGFQLFELLNLNDRFPFRYIGWNIGVLAKKTVIK